VYLNVLCVSCVHSDATQSRSAVKSKFLISPPVAHENHFFTSHYVREGNRQRRSERRKKSNESR
jgi:hypothetical protein